MIPIRDTIPSGNVPILNNTIIGLNIFFYLIKLAQGTAVNQFIFTYGLVPARYSNPELAAYFSFGQQALALVSFMFIHGGFWHILGNMWSLYIFGDNVEDRLGHFRYLLFYLLCGWASGLFHLLTNWDSQIPTIGASGAIAGIMGAYLVLYPGSRILTLIPIFFIPYFIEIPAVFFLGIWFILQLLNATSSGAAGGGIAWWAHIGGFIVGILGLRLFLKVPPTGVSDWLKRSTSKRKTPHLQVIRSEKNRDELHLYGTVFVSPWEARHGTRKLVNVPVGLQKRLFRITVPAGVNDGTVLRLSGMGRAANDGHKGDLFLKVRLGQ
jgi:membrane associated rhomboid family serine protease